MDFNKMLNTAKHFVRKNSPAILTGMAIVGVIGITASAIKDTTVAVRKVKVKSIEEGRELTKPEIIRTAAPCYISTGLSVAATLACIVGAHRTGHAQTAAYATAYTVAQEAATNYRKQVEQIVSKKELEKIDNAVADNSMKSAKNQPIVVGDGKVLCYDQFSGRYFQSDMQTLREVQNDLNERCLDEMWVNVNTYYYHIGLDSINAGEELGWTVDEKLKLKFSSRLSEDGRPCLVVSFDTSPSAEFYRKY